jgi:hypothetical protein
MKFETTKLFIIFVILWMTFPCAKNDSSNNDDKERDGDEDYYNHGQDPYYGEHTDNFKGLGGNDPKPEPPNILFFLLVVVLPCVALPLLIIAMVCFCYL